MQLQAQLRAGAALLLVVAASICAYVYVGYAQVHRQSARDLRVLTSYDQVLGATNALAAERAPSNMLLSVGTGDTATDAATRARVAQARQQTDAALARMDQLISARPDIALEHAQLAQAQTSLAQARAAYDALARSTPLERSPQAMQSAIDDMLAARRQLDPLIDDFYRAATRLAPDQAGTMQMARVMSELHQSGGLLASMLMVPLSAPEPIGTTRRLAIARLRGRIEALHSMMPTRSDARVPLQQDIDRARMQVERRFFGHMLPLVDRLVAHTDDDYGLRASDFTAQVLPDLMALEQLEKLFMQRAIDQVTDVQRNAFWHMLFIGAFLLSFLLFLLSVLRAAERLVVRPLLLAKNEIVALAGGDLRRAPRIGHSEEVRALHDAIDALRRQQSYSMQLAIERDELSKALRQQAHTDALTGLLNRHALEEITGDLSAEPVRISKDRGLILIDVDYFKPINDEYGHVVGDLVLREVARRIQHLVREPHMAFRYGGEEFAVLTIGLSMKDLCQLAEGIRHAVFSEDIRAPGAAPLTVTASFGVAKGNASTLTWLDLLNTADAALYQAKAQGRNQLVAANELIGDASSDRPISTHT